MKSNAPKSILFVCSGNICRSPLAEGLLKYYIDSSETLARCEIEVSSAGTFDTEPSAASEYSQVVAREFGADITGHISRHLTRKIIMEADLIVVMAENHYEFIADIFPDMIDKVKFLSEFSDGKRDDIPDPYGYGIDYYREVGDLINENVLSLVSYLEKGRNCEE